MTDTTAYYKVLRPGREATHVPGFIWPEPGEWLEVEGELVPCRNGLHVLRSEHVLTWLEPGDDLWRVEVGEERVDAGDKVAVRRARLVEQVPNVDRRLRLFAADCAERVLPLYEQENPGDDRPRKAIEAARAYARGEITAAARAAAWDAAWAAAWDAAGDDAAGDDAWDAAGDAAWDAARAARDAAGDAARAAWAARDAAGDAARDAAGDAAWAAAWDAAWAAAGDAARDAAGDAARAAERAWQNARLADYLEGRAA